MDCLCSLDDEITIHIQNVNQTFKNLEDCVLTKRKIKVSTKMLVHRSCTLSCFLYSCETWVTYQKHIRAFEIFPQYYLRAILKIHWLLKTQDIEILDLTSMHSIETNLKTQATLNRSFDQRG